MSKTAHIIAIQRDSLDGFFGFGITGDPRRVEYVMESSEVWVGPRPTLETNEAFLQPIPYIALKIGEKYVTYRRDICGEDRLAGKVSMGFGGHVDVLDAAINEDGSIDLPNTILTAALRELREEVGVAVHPSKIRFSGIISVKETVVDRVHIGIVIVVNADGLPLTFEEGMGQIEHLTPAEILQNPNLETWTRLLASALLD